AGEAGGEAPAHRVPARVVQAEALDHRPGRVEEVEAQGDVGDDVDERDHRPLEAGHDVAVDVAPHEVGVGRAPGEVGQVPEHEEQDDDAGHPHRAAGDGGGLVVALGDVAALGAGPAVDAGQPVGGVDVEEEGQDQADPQQLQRDRAGEDRHQQVAQELAVVVDVV